MKTIIATTSTFANECPELIRHLASHGLDIIINPYGRKLDDNEIKALLEKYKPCGILAGTETISGLLLHAANAYLRVISRVGVGWDNIDKEAAKEFNILVYRTTGVLTKSVSELTLGLMLSALRNICVQDRDVRNGQWNKKMGSLLEGKNVGIIGFGAIGQRVGELAKAFGAHISYYDKDINISIPWAQPVSLHDIMFQSDIISIHASGKDQVIGYQELEQIKKGVIIINTARGELIDEKALESYLTNGMVGYACLDVFSSEPYQGKLRKLDNVILTPHIGSYAREARYTMEKAAADNLLDGLRKAKVI